MPEKRTIKKAQALKRTGKSPSTQAGAFVHESIEHVKKGKHGARSTKQAIAIGLSEARRSGVAIPDKSAKKTTTAKSTKKAATRKTSTVKKSVATKASTPTSTSHIHARKVSPKKSKAAVKRLQNEPTSTVSHAALSRHAKAAARTRGKSNLHEAAIKGAKTRAKHAR